MKLNGVASCLGCIAVSVVLAGCAMGSSTPAPDHLASAENADDPPAVSDPNEKFNRSVFDSNQGFNHSILYPTAKAYNENVPEPVRNSIESFATNLGEPVVFANDILQLRIKAAMTTFGRFAINSTIGLGGLFDVAATQGMAHQSGDFGQTMYVWGYRNSDYLVLPIIGPTNTRDAIGSAIEFAAQLPTGALMPTKIASTMSALDVAGGVASPLTGLGKAEDMQTLEDSSIDFYSMLRSVSDQKRQAELQEALVTSALTGNPDPVDPYAIVPVNEIVSSPMMLEKRPRLSANSTGVAKSTSTRGGSMVIIDPPQPAPAKVD